jgi:hypothetical protein
MGIEDNRNGSAEPYPQRTVERWLAKEKGDRTS